MAPRISVYEIRSTETDSIHGVDVQIETPAGIRSGRGRVNGREITPGVWGFSSTFGATFPTFAEAVAAAVRDAVRS